jgi:8-oxo-dGTP diphosphatase
MIRVTCAVIRNDDEEVLVVQRGEATDHPMKWEFPGGKLAAEENDEECVIREVQEELSMEIVICGKLPDVEYDYGHKKIKLIPFICDTLDEFPFLSEHIAYRWISAHDLLTVDFSEADIFVANSYLEIIRPERKKEAEMISGEYQEIIEDHGLQSMINSMISMKEVDWVATSAIENQAIFAKLLEYSYSSDKRLAFRASWTLSKVCDKFPEMIYPFLPGIIEALDQLDNESAQRSFLRILSLSDMEKISQKHHGILADHCFMALRSGISAIAIKAYSMEILYKLTLKYPELRNELSASINILQGEGSAGIVARGRIILKKLAEAPVKPASNQPRSC